VLQVTLVPYQADDDVGVGVVPQLLQPPFYIVEGHCEGKGGEVEGGLGAQQKEEEQKERDTRATCTVLRFGVLQLMIKLLALLAKGQAELNNFSLGLAKCLNSQITPN